MSLYQRAIFDQHMGAMPGVTFVDQWGGHVAKVGGKVFAILVEDASMTLKCGEASFDILTALDGIGQAPYFAKGTWVEVRHSAPLDDETLLAYLQRSHAAVASGLTRKLRLELGIA